MIKSHELVSRVLRGEDCGRTPLYGWLAANLKEELTAAYGSVEAFEDRYEFDLAHIFGGPSPHDLKTIRSIRESGQELTPQMYLDIALPPVDNLADYDTIRAALRHHRDERGRFCYLQTPGVFECLNGAFGIENHLCYMALYPDELNEVYLRQADWNRRFALNAIELGVDMIHVSDDWGAQKSTMFSTDMWRDLIRPYHAITAQAVKQAGKFLSLHSDGHVMPLVDEIIDLGYDLMHPWQESAGMGYDTWLERYSDKIAIMGGMCVQTTVGFDNPKKLEQQIRRVFALLQGKRWICCTTHYVQSHCSMEELSFTFDLASSLAHK